MQLRIGGLQREEVPADQRAGLPRAREKTRALRRFQRPHGRASLVLEALSRIRRAPFGLEEGIYWLQFSETPGEMAVPVSSIDHSLFFSPVIASSFFFLSAFSLGSDGLFR